MIRLALAAGLLLGLVCLTPSFVPAAEPQATLIDRYRQVLLADPGNLTLHYQLGLALLNAGRPAEALDELRRSYPSYSDSIEANYSLSLACLRLNDLDGAILYLDQAETLGIGGQTEIYTVASLTFNLALKAVEQGRDNDAIRLFQKVLTFDPARAEVHRQLGGIYTRQGNHDLALKAFQRHLELVPDDPLTRECLFTIEFNRAQDALHRGDMNAAEQGFAAAAALKPEHPALLYYRGYLDFQRRRPAEASVLLQRSLVNADSELRQALRPLIYNCSLALSDAGDMEAAVRGAEVLANLPDADGNELFLAGALNIKAGRYLTGKGYLERLLRQEPTHADALKYLVAAETGADQEALANTRQALAAGDYSTAVTALTTVRALQPESSQLPALADQIRELGLDTARKQLAAAKSSLNAGDHTAARDAWQKGLASCPDDAEGRQLQQQFAREFSTEKERQLTLARTALEAGRWSEALAIYSGIIVLEPDNREARTGAQVAAREKGLALDRLLAAGELALKDRQAEPARSAFTQALALAPGQPGATAGLAAAGRMLQEQAGEALRQGRQAAALGRLDEARTFYETSRQAWDDGVARTELEHLDTARQDRIATLLQKAGQAVMKKDFRQAGQLYTQASALDPTHHGILSGRQALVTATSAAAREALGRGDEALARDDLAGALAAYRGVLNLTPDNSAAQAGLKRTRQRQSEQLARLGAEGERAFSAGDLAAAGRAVEQVLKLDPYHADAVRLRERIEQTRLGGARPGDEQALYLQGVALYTKGSYQEAIHAWETVLALNPGFEKARENINKTRRKLRQIEEYRGG